MYSSTNEVTALAPVRWLYVVPMAASTTFALMVLMFKLIYMEEVVITDVVEIPIPPVVLEPREDIEVIKKNLEKPREIDPSPPKPELRNMEKMNMELAVANPGYKPPKDAGPMTFNFDAPVEAYIVTPRYPGRALARGIEGFVELRFDVNKTGATENIEILRAEPKGIFEKAAVAAAERWKFQPKTENGNPVYFRGLAKVVTFEMQDS